MPENSSRITVFTGKFVLPIDFCGGLCYTLRVYNVSQKGVFCEKIGMKHKNRLSFMYGISPYIKGRRWFFQVVFAVNKSSKNGQ